MRVGYARVSTLDELDETVLHALQERRAAVNSAVR
jgi:hypothetical protein